MTNIEIADLLRAVAAAYQIHDEKKNRFRIIAYERAADAVEHLSTEAKDLWDDNKLADIAGVGTSIAANLDEIFKTGKSKHFSDIMENIPAAVFELIKIPGVGPKNGFRLAQELNISKNDPISQLENEAKSGQIALLEGFGVDSQNVILKGIEEFKGRGEKRMLLPYALTNAELVLDWLKKSDYIKQADVLGSLRRQAATVGDIDIAVASNNPEKAIEHFINYPNIKRVIEKGDRSATILIPPELHVDLMVQDPASYGSLLQHFTGSKHHNIKLREYAQKNKLSLSEYGIKATDNMEDSKTYLFENEEKFYIFLGMQWIPPELREDKGEIEAALMNKIPKLIELEDIKADLQIHTNFDVETSHDLGQSSMEDIADKAEELGYEYIAFTEHNPSQKGHNERQIVEILKRKREAVDKFNDKLKKDNLKKVFNSLEIDILPEGKLPVPEEGLNTLDFALVSIHSSFRIDRSEMTKRVIDALTQPKVKIFAHPTGRKINEREGIELDWEKVFDYVLKNNKWLEINADPMRLDLPDSLVFEAVKYGVKMTMGTDAHHAQHMANMRFGLSVARRGWATKDMVVNSYSLDRFEKMLD